MSRANRTARPTAPLLVVSLLLVTACGGNTVDVAGGYTPPFLPVTLWLESNGTIRIEGDASVVTPIGTFSVAAGIDHNMDPPDDSILLIVRHHKEGVIVDEAFKVGDEEIEVVVDGRTVISVTNRRVLIDASDGTVQQVVIRSTRPTSAPVPIAPVVPFTDPLNASAHSPGWDNDPSQGCYFGDDGYHATDNSVCRGGFSIADADVSVAVTVLREEESEWGGCADRGRVLGPAQLSVRFGGGDGWMSVNLGICTDGTWWGTMMPDESYHSDAVNVGVGATNILRIRMVGARFDYFINDVRVGGIDDPPEHESEVHYDWGTRLLPKSGDIAFINYPSGDVLFTNLTVLPVA